MFKKLKEKLTGETEGQSQTYKRVVLVCNNTKKLTKKSNTVRLISD